MAGGAMKKVSDALSAMKKGGKKTLVTFHSLGDLDACASALFVADIIGKEAIVAPPDRVNSESRRLLSGMMGSFMSFDRAAEKYPDCNIVLVDCNDPSLLSHLEGIKPDALIDHHAIQKNSVRAHVEWVQPESSSTCEMVAELAPIIRPQFADILALGVLSDSAHLRRASPKTFAMLAKLLTQASMDYDAMLSLLEKPSGAASRAAVLEGLRNVTWQEKGGIVCATAAVSSHEGNVAEVLVGAGADCAFAGTAGKHDVRISGRMRRAMAAKVDLPKIMEKVGEKIEGHGGGHMLASGATGKRADLLDDALALCAREFFRQAGGL